MKFIPKFLKEAYSKPDPKKKQFSDRQMVTFVIMFAIVSMGPILFISGGFSLINTNNELTHNGIQTTAKVIRIEGNLPCTGKGQVVSKLLNTGGYCSRVTKQFYDQNGEIITDTKFGSTRPGREVGDIVPVTYSKKDPHLNLPQTLPESVYVGVFIIFLGLLLLLYLAPFAFKLLYYKKI